MEIPKERWRWRKRSLQRQDEEAGISVRPLDGQEGELRPVDWQEASPVTIGTHIIGSTAESQVPRPGSGSQSNLLQE